MNIEAEIATNRINGSLRTQAALQAQAYASTQSKKAAKLFQKTLEKLQ